MTEMNRDMVAERGERLSGRESGQSATSTSGQVARGRSGDADCGVNDNLVQLIRTIENEIIPRLMMAHISDAERQPVATHGLPVRSVSLDIEEFARRLLAADDSLALRYVEEARGAGFGLDELYLDLMAPAAQRLGYLWDEDLCSFSEVTVGLSRLHRMLMELGPLFHSSPVPEGAGRRALLVAAPGEQHTFGLFMLMEFFRREGWEVWGEPVCSIAELAHAVQDIRFELVGLSAGTTQRVADLRDAVAAIRRASRNESVVVMVGGPLFVDHPEYVEEIGADGSAADGRAALLTAETLVRNARCRTTN